MGINNKGKIGLTLNETIRKHMHESLTIGITFDTKNDFKFTQDDPWDWDAEFQVSMAVDDIVRAIEDLGHQTVLIGSGRKLLENFSRHEKEIDMIFNIAEGKFGRSRESQIPSMLELAGIPFVGSDAYTLTVALNKWHTKIIGKTYGIRTPEFAIIEKSYSISKKNIPKFPVIAKLCYGGSSMGIDEHSKIYDFEELEKRVKYMLKTYHQPVLVEEFISGIEVDIPIIGNNPDKIFGVVGISLDGKEMGERYLTSKIVYDDKYSFQYPLNADFEPEAAQMALGVYNALGCTDFGRVDMRIDPNGVPYFLEINPYPYLGKHSSFNYIAEKNGLAYKDMIGMILQNAISRYSF